MSMLVILSRCESVDIAQGLTAQAKRLAIQLCAEQGKHMTVLRLWGAWHVKHSPLDLGKGALGWLLVACTQVCVAVFCDVCLRVSVLFLYVCVHALWDLCVGIECRAATDLVTPCVSFSDHKCILPYTQGKDWAVGEQLLRLLSPFVFALPTSDDAAQQQLLLQQKEGASSAHAGDKKLLIASTSSEQQLSMQAANPKQAHSSDSSEDASTQPQSQQQKSSPPVYAAQDLGSRLAGVFFVWILIFAWACCVLQCMRM